VDSAGVQATRLAGTIDVPRSLSKKQKQAVDELAEVMNGKVWTARPVTVIKDSADEIALWLAQAAIEAELLGIYPVRGAVPGITQGSTSRKARNSKMPDRRKT